MWEFTDVCNLRRFRTQRIGRVVSGSDEAPDRAPSMHGNAIS
jgi:hypothetical protein